MKNIISRILSVFKKRNEKSLQLSDINNVCQSDPGELDQYCRIEGFSK